MTIKGIILDIDGVLRRGSEIIPGSLEAVESMFEKGLKICCLSNNSTRSSESLARSLREFGYPGMPVIGSAEAAAKYISENHGSSRCLAVGEKGVVEELEKEGHEVFIAGEGKWRTAVDGADGEDVIIPPKIDCVVAGMDRELTYAKLVDALHCLKTGARFIATNQDPTFPAEYGLLMPGAGATIGAIRGTSGIDPQVIAGKPNTYSTTIALRLLQLRADEVLTVGDRIDTDIAAGQAAGTQVALVLTGELKEVDGSVDFPVFDDLSSLVRGML